MPTTPTIEELERARVWLELELLRDEIAMLRRQLAGEVRTRRVVVVDERGFSRVVIDTRAQEGSVEVRGQAKRGQRFSIALLASEASAMASAGVYVMEHAEEQTVVELEAVGRIADDLDRVPKGRLTLGYPGVPSIYLGTYSTEAEVSLKAVEPLRSEDEQARVALHVQQGWTDSACSGLPMASVLVEGAKTTAITEDGEQA